MNKINNTSDSGFKKTYYHTKIILFIFYLSFLINPVLGNSNLIFQSDNEKIINIIDIDNGYNQTSSNSTNQSINLSYHNYNIKLYATNTKISNNNGTFILNNLEGFSNDWQIAFWLALIIGLVLLFFKIFSVRL